MALSEELLKILACPACKGFVQAEGEYVVCQNVQCHLKFPIVDGIPIMLIEEAKKLS